MDDLSQKNPVYTGLILLTGSDAPGIAKGLFEAISEFSIQIHDVEQLVISHRLVLTVLITLNPVHQNAIEADLAEYAQTSHTDIATIFSEQNLVPVDSNRVSVQINSNKLHPKSLLGITSAIVEAKGNIESISRTQSDPTEILFIVTGSKAKELEPKLESLKHEDELEFKVSEL
jgi:phosphoserine phosphatase